MVKTIVAVLILSTVCWADNAIIFPGNTMKLSWSRVTTDVNGSPEDSVHYNVDICTFLDTTKINRWTLSDTMLTVDISGYEPTYYCFRVRAVDRAGNVSVWLYSHDCENNHFGCWIIGKDTVPPMRIKEMRYGELAGHKTFKWRAL